MSNRPFLTRQDFAVALGVSPECVRNNEKRWGLDKCRRQLNRRMVHYLNPEASVILRQLEQRMQAPSY